MNSFTGLEEIVETDYPLARRTWYGLGGKADFFIRPKTVEQLKKVVRRCNENNIPIYVMGFGSNLLISDDGLRAAVIKLEAEQLAQIEFDAEEVTAWAGAELSKLVLTCVEKGLSGIEALTGIPGSVGGAVKNECGGQLRRFRCSGRKRHADGRPGQCLRKEQTGAGIRLSQNKYRCKIHSQRPVRNLTRLTRNKSCGR